MLLEGKNVARNSSLKDKRSKVVLLILKNFGLVTKYTNIQSIIEHLVYARYYVEYCFFLLKKGSYMTKTSICSFLNLIVTRF